jgi:putative nucleotidyltransferase with HDIG domain
MAERRIRLRAIGPVDKEQKWDGERRLRIGRIEAFEVVLDDPSVSRRHAEVEYTEQGWVARDLGSSNGTFLNGVRISRSDRPVRPQDLLQCGNLVLRVEPVNDEAPDVSDTLSGNLQVQATTRQTLLEAADRLFLDVTRSTRPGEQLLNLLRTGQCLDRIDSLDELLHRSLRDTVGFLRARRGAVLMIDDGTGKLNLRAVQRSGSASGSGQHYSHTLASRCMRSGQSLLCADIHADPELVGATSVRGAPMSSIICALLRTPQNNLGVLHLDRGPSDDPFTRDDLHLADALACNMSSSIESARLFQERQRNLFIQTVIAFSQAIEMRDQYTGGHAKRVTDYSLHLAQEMALSETDRHYLSIGAPLHDIGKIGIDDVVLRKHERLTPEEFEQMKSHTVKGAAILATIPGLEQVIPIVRNHHERWDGAGYPDGLAGAQISRLACVVAVADTFDAMTTDRPYRAGLPAEEAFEQIACGAGSQFDPACVAAFLRLQEPLGHLVRQQQALEHTDLCGSGEVARPALDESALVA